MAELAETLGKIVEHHRTKSTQPNYPKGWPTLHDLESQISLEHIGTPWVSCRFADVHAKTRKSRAEVGQNIITVDSALFKFTVAKISNSDFYSK